MQQPHQNQGSPYSLPPQYSVPARQTDKRSPSPPPVPPKPSNSVPGSYHNQASASDAIYASFRQNQALDSPPVPPPARRSYVDTVPRSPSRPSSSSSWSSAEAASSSARLAPSTPRKRLFVKGKMSPARHMGSPRRAVDDERRAERERRRKNTAPPPPTIWTTLGHILAPIRMFLAPVRVLLGPLWWHLVNTALLVLFVLGVLWAITAYLQNLISSIGGSVASNAALIPLRAIATPACLLTNSMCGLSLFSTKNTSAQPVWKLFSGITRSEVDVAAVSRELSREARNAKDIFESLTALGDGRMTAGLGHVR